MGDGTEENPYTREDVLRLIKENGGIADGLDLSGKWFDKGTDLRKFDLLGIILMGTYLTEANLQGADLVRANLQNAHLMDANLQGANLARANLQGAELHSANLQGANLAGANLKNVSLTMANIQDARLWRADLGGAQLWDANLKGATIEGVKWGPKYIVGDEPKFEREINENARRQLLEMAESVYRNLKRCHIEQGLYDIAGKFFYREMEVRRKKLGWQPLWGEKVRLNIYKWLYGYGEKPWQVVLWGILVLFGLALFYFFLRGVAPYTFTMDAFLSSLYYSAVSFTALGYGPWFSASSVHSWVQGVGAAESIIGVFMIALFLVTFTRKMTR